MVLSIALIPSAGWANSESSASNVKEFGQCNADPIYEQDFVGKTKLGSRVRSVACMNGSKILTTVPAGTKLKVLSKTDGWYKVKTSGGITGWMGAWLVSKTDASWIETAPKEVVKTGNLGTAVSAMENLSLKDMYLLREKLLKKIEILEQKQEEQKKIEQKKIEIENFVSNSQGTIKLGGESGIGAVKLSWELISMTSPLGFKVVVANHENPVYPGDEYHYFSDANVRSDSWNNLINGTHYFRVCEYLGGKCGVYSNNIKVTVSE
ncbi:SH3 domain-containing protein [Patescibacteria group bacterium]|nr:SH3 domain-containing protein [Patescibacteria group bacterium]MBU1613283.1 SH3 domain-containing protein [Patescibacteria group bacterium]